MDLLKAFILYVSQGIGLVPAGREDIEGDLTANSECETVVGELFFEDFDEGCTDLMNLRIHVREVSSRNNTSTEGRVIPCRKPQSHDVLGRCVVHISLMRIYEVKEEYMRCVASQGTNIDHSIAELDEGAPEIMMGPLQPGLENTTVE